MPLTECIFEVNTIMLIYVPLANLHGRYYKSAMFMIKVMEHADVQFWHSSLIPCCIFRKLAQCQIPQSPGTCYLGKVVTLWRELNLKSRFLNYSGAYAKKTCYESNLKILILSIGVCLRSIQPDICNKIAFKQNYINFEKCR